MSEALGRHILNPRTRRDSLPLEGYVVKGVVGDVIVGFYADVDKDGNVLRPGSTILLPNMDDIQSWRILEVTIIGPEVKDVKVGDFIVISNTEGLKGCDFHQNERIFISESKHVFLILEKDGDHKSAFEKDVKAKITLVEG